MAEKRSLVDNLSARSQESATEGNGEGIITHCLNSLLNQQFGGI